MSFDYDKLKEKEEQANWWASYSDLWSMLSVVFLVMYVATSLRTGTQGIRQELENQTLAQKNAELEEQLKVYATLRDETLQKSSEEEQKVYEKLMSKLSLLQEEAKDEKNDLRRKAKENEEKEYALNQYQQIVRNIVDTNVLAKASIQTRDNVIKDKRQTIAQKKAEISKLSQEVEQREKSIAANESQITSITQTLDVQIKKLEQAKNDAKISADAMQKTVERLRQTSAKKIAAIKQANQEVRAKMQAELQQTEVEYRSQLAAMRAENTTKLEQEQHEFNAKLKKQKLGSAAKAKKLEEFNRLAESRAQALEQNLSGLVAKMSAVESQLAGTEGKLQSKQSELVAAKGKLQVASRSLAQAESTKSKLVAANTELGSQLSAAQERLAARKNLINQIKKNFAANGIKAAVDGKTGDVIIDFGEEYFDSGKASLKPGMINALKKMMPAYSESLFKDAKTAEKISNIEIIGFASSTFKGKYVNPASLKAENQAAINYNLKLSFDRANSIFRHVFDPKKLSYTHQQRLLPLVKVVGRGFLPDGKQAKDLPDNMPTKEFCQKFNCQKAQRVIIKFNLKD